MSGVTTFLDACVRGQVQVEDVDNWVDSWHDAKEGSDTAALSLHSYLGLSWAEYGRWLHNASALAEIVAEHTRRAYDEANQYAGETS
jgi:hypothetical protein